MTDKTEWFGEPRRDPVVVVYSDPEWGGLYEQYRTKLANPLGPVALRINHVGSTAIRGLPAKPVIDIQVSVSDVTNEDSYRPAIESLGWPLRAREPDHRFFRPPATEERFVHVHVCSAGSGWEHRHLLFVAYLRAHPEHTARYARLKHDLAQRFGADRQGYTDAKNDFIAETLALADAWVARTGWQP